MGACLGDQGRRYALDACLAEAYPADPEQGDRPPLKTKFTSTMMSAEVTAPEQLTSETVAGLGGGPLLNAWFTRRIMSDDVQ